MKKPKKKNTWTQIRLSPEEKEILQEKASALGLSISAYIRMKALFEQNSETIRKYIEAQNKK